MEPENFDALDKIFMNFEQLTGYKDFPETEEIENSFWEYISKDIFKNEVSGEMLKFEKALINLTSVREKQGFINGFNYALTLLGIRQPEKNI